MTSSQIQEQHSKKFSQGKDPQGLSDSDSDDDDCSEDESDLIRFLGLVPSPSIDQALQTLGLEGVKKQGNEPVSRKLVTKKRKHSNVAISARRKRLSKTRLGFGSDPCGKVPRTFYFDVKC